MSKQSQKITEEASTTTEEGTATSTNPSQSNAEQIQKVKDASYVANYEAALGEFLGSKLFDSISEYLDPKEFSGIANNLLESVLSKGLTSLGEGESANISEEAGAKITQILMGELSPFVDQFFASEKGQKCINYIKDVIGENPYPVAGIAILAAVGAIVADMDIPTLKQKFGITKGLTLGLEAKLGSLRNITMESIKTTLAYNKGKLKLETSVARNEEGKISGEASAKFGTEEQHIKGNVTVDENGATIYGLGAVTTISGTKLTVDAEGNSTDSLTNVSVGFNDPGDVTQSGNTSYNLKTKDLSFAYNQSKEKGLSIGGGFSGNVGTGQLNEYNLNSSYQFDKTDLKIGGGLSHNLQDNSLNYNAFARQNLLDDRLQLNGNLSGTDQGLSKMGIGGKYNTDSGLYSANYNHNFDTGRHNLDLMGQQRFNDFSVRGRQQFDYSQDEGLSSTSELLGAYHMNNDLALIGGAEYQHNRDGGKFLPKAGVQYKEIPIVITYDPETRATSVGISLKF
jgi:hypothetical protein